VNVHNHGTEEGDGLACRELLIDGDLKGECLRTPLVRACPTCNARPGYRCNAPTNTGRRDVLWFHYTREDDK
jgi:hypothetical protein